MGISQEDIQMAAGNARKDAQHHSYQEIRNPKNHNSTFTIRKKHVKNLQLLILERVEKGNISCTLLSRNTN